MVTPVFYEERDLLLDLLCEGFPQPRSFWAAGLQRIQNLGGNALTGVPLGYVMHAEGRPAGVVLTPARLRRKQHKEAALAINISSWYVTPEHRWRAPAMLHAVLKSHDAIYTDLSPTVEVQEIIAALGFKPINRGVIVTPLPAVVAKNCHGAKVRDLDESSVADLPDEIGQLLLRHKEIGCLTALLETRNKRLPMMFRSCRYNGMPAAELIYCESNAALAENLSAAARYLLARGKLIMIGDNTGQALHFGQFRRPFGLKFARPGAGLSIVPDRIDHAGSELCFFAS